MLERLLDLARDRQLDRLSASGRIGQLVVEGPFDPGSALPVDVGVADHVRGEARLRIEPVRLTLQRNTRLADRVHRFDQARRRPPPQVEEALVGAKHGEIGRLVLLRHQLREPARELQLVADDLARPESDGPGVDRPGKRLAVAIDDVPTLGDQGRNPSLGAGMIAECREIEDPDDDQRDDAGVDQKAEHQPLVHHGQNLPSLPDKSEPLGPGCDESGGRCVHRAVPEFPVVFFELALAGSGASGSTLAVRTGFVTGPAASASFLSPAFLSAAAGFVSGAFADFVGAGFTAFDALALSAFAAVTFVGAGAFFATGFDMIGCSSRGSGRTVGPASWIGSRIGTLRLACCISCAADDAVAPAPAALRSPSSSGAGWGFGAGAEASTTGASTFNLGSGRPSRASWKPPSRNWSANGADKARTFTFQRSSCARRPRVPISVCSRRMSRWASTIFVSTSSSAARSDATLSETR